MATHTTVNAESRDYHTKAQTNLRLTDDGRAALRALAGFYGLGISDVVEMLVRERIHDLKLNVNALIRGTPAKKRARR